jgi:hypothetical protein
MITVTLTSVNGDTKRMNFESKEKINEFIIKYRNVLKVGTSVCIDAPLVGIHSGWIRGTKVD